MKLSHIKRLICILGVTASLMSAKMDMLQPDAPKELILAIGGERAEGYNPTLG